MAERRAADEPEATDRTGGHRVGEGRLPVTEILFDRAGAASPFGDDLTLPLPPESLAYRHP